MPEAVVDAHHHLWQIKNGTVCYPWLAEAYDPEHFILGDYKDICCDFGVLEFQKAFGDTPVVASVHVEAECKRSDALAETRWLHQIANNGSIPSAVVAWVDLLADDADERLTEQAAYPLVRGVRFKPRTSRSAHMKIDGPGTLLDLRWPRALERLAAHNLSWDLRVPFWHLEEAADMLSAAPNIDVVLEHAGLPWDRSDQGLSCWRKGIEKLSRNQKVSVKLSEFGLPEKSWTEVENRKIIRDTISIFGAERCMFASNFPVASLRVSYSALVETFDVALKKSALTPQAQHAVWHDNAIRIYRIKKSEPK